MFVFIISAPQFQENAGAVNNKTINFGSRTYLCLCYLKKPSLLPRDGKLFLLKDGSIKLSIKIEFNTTMIDPEVNEICSSSRYFAYHFPQVSLADQGFYQCAFQPESTPKLIVSKKMYMTVKGNNTSLICFLR